MRESGAARARASSRATPKIRSENIQPSPQSKLFRVLAKHRFPRKTAPAVRALTGYHESTIYDWLKGKSEAPFSVYVAIIVEIMKRS